MGEKAMVLFSGGIDRQKAFEANGIKDPALRE